ncbi:glycoside hydrolase family 6 protein [Kocuria sabuli]|uniref:glycoside hydrolase family 6 protein n=1 Tax=Kocuria sabuli TaxID=3071448 RepID=UPI0034D45125
MPGRPPSPVPRAGVAVTVALLTVAGLAGLPAAAGIVNGMTFRDPQPNRVEQALDQAAQLEASGNSASAEALRAVASTPQADWMVSGTPEEVRQQVRRSTTSTADEDRPPVLVAYNLPLRDCAQYSSGGAASVAEYKAWIDGFAAGIEDRKALIVLEPDGLGQIPWYTGTTGEPDSCRPDGADGTTAADRFEMLSYAVDALTALPDTRVYLDGTHSGWLAVGDAAERLVRAGVERADGFALNVSNFETTEKQLAYGTWVSKCIHFGTRMDPGNFAGCGSQYHPASADDVSTWGRTDAWYAEHVDDAANGPAGPGDLAHFVVDTSRNGQGPWTPELSSPDPQPWCNPPGRGLGRPPSTETGHELADAFLWIKVPGESDGECDRGRGPGVPDPGWGLVPPPAGAWFPEQALDLVENADPPLRR